MINEMDDISVVIITGAKDTFISGTDINELAGTSVSQVYNIALKLRTLQDAIIKSQKIFIAAINGHYLGAGMELALVCDFRIA